MRRLYLFFLKKYDPIKWARSLGVKVGKGTTLDPDVSFPSEPYLITIGEHVQVTQGVSFYTHGGGHVLRDCVPNFDSFGKIKVEDGAYLGAHCLILPGVTIGKGALVAAGSVVTKSVPPFMVVAGNPARIICTVKEYANRNLKYNVDTRSLSREEKKQLLLSLEDDCFICK